jgi:hypothetical protein
MVNARVFSGDEIKVSPCRNIATIGYPALEPLFSPEEDYYRQAWYGVTRAQAAHGLAFATSPESIYCSLGLTGFPNTRILNIMASDGEGNYATQVQSFSDEELVLKERSKRRRKTGDVVGTGLSAAAAMGSPALWAVAGASAKSYLDNSSKHKIILAEMKRRGLEPEKGDMSDTLWPILTSVGTTAVGRAFGGSAGQGIASQAGNLMHNVSNRAFGSSSTTSKKDKQSKKVPQYMRCTDYLKSKTPAQAPAMISAAAAQPQQAQALQQSAMSYAQPVRTLQTPSAYQVPANQAPPATLVYQYVPPSAQYPQGCYAPVLSQQTPIQAAPVATTSPPPYQQSQQQFGQPPALNYVTSPSQPQYYQNQPQPGLNRAQTFYSPANSHTTLGRANTVAYM